MATFFIPSFYGFGGGTYWGNMPFTDYPNYMGIIVITLAIIGILFYKKKIKETNALIAILVGLSLGLAVFPNTDFSQSILVGIFLPKDLFPQIITNYLLFWSFLLATLSPVIAIISYDSFKR